MMRPATLSADRGGMRLEGGTELTCLFAPVERVIDLVFGYAAEAERRAGEILAALQMQNGWFGRRHKDVSD